MGSMYPLGNLPVEQILRWTPIYSGTFCSMLQFQIGMVPVFFGKWSINLQFSSYVHTVSMIYELWVEGGKKVILTSDEKPKKGDL